MDTANNAIMCRKVEMCIRMIYPILMVSPWLLAIRFCSNHFRTIKFLLTNLLQSHYSTQNWGLSRGYNPVVTLCSWDAIKTLRTFQNFQRPLSLLQEVTSFWGFRLSFPKRHQAIIPHDQDICLSIVLLTAFQTEMCYDVLQNLCGISKLFSKFAGCWP